MFSQLLTLTTSILCAESSLSLLESSVKQKRSSIFVQLSGGCFENFSLTQEQRQQIDEALKTGYQLKVLATEMGRGSFPLLTQYDSMSQKELTSEFNEFTELNLSLEQKLREMATKQEENAAAGYDCVPCRDPETVKHHKKVQENLKEITAALILLRSDSFHEFKELNGQLAALVEQIAKIRFTDESHANDENPNYIHCKNKLRDIILQ